MVIILCIVIPGFKEGWIWWNNYDPLNFNSARGAIPDGDFGPRHNTKIHYCCRQDGNPRTAISLPTLNPFYLMMIGDKCQAVIDMSSRAEWILWDNFDLARITPRHWQTGGLHPRNDHYYENNKLFFCFYQRHRKPQILPNKKGRTSIWIPPYV